MIKSELIAKIAEENPHLYQRDAEAVVNAILDTITVALARGDRVELRGFGMFTVKHRDAYVGRNPRNRKQVAVAEKLIPTFKMSKIMRSLLNPSDALWAPIHRTVPPRPPHARQRPVKALPGFEITLPSNAACRGTVS